jgi:hypothetical protein
MIEAEQMLKIVAIEGFPLTCRAIDEKHFLKHFLKPVLKPVVFKLFLTLERLYMVHKSSSYYSVVRFVLDHFI